MPIPPTVKDRGSYALANDLRIALKQTAALVNGLREQLAGQGNGEAIANATITYRHLEDASMRLGKVLHALDGGVSVYDRATTVGVPDATGHDDAPSVAEVEGLRAASGELPGRVVELRNRDGDVVERFSTPPDNERSFE